MTMVRDLHAYPRGRRRSGYVPPFPPRPSIGLLAGSLVGFSLLMLGALAAFG